MPKIYEDINTLAIHLDIPYSPSTYVLTTDTLDQANEKINAIVLRRTQHFWKKLQSSTMARCVQYKKEYLRLKSKIK